MLKRTVLSQCRSLAKPTPILSLVPHYTTSIPSVSSHSSPTLYTASYRHFASSSGSSSSGDRQQPQVFGQSGKYALALFNTAKKRGGDTLNRLQRELQTFYRAYQSNVQLSQALDNPVLSAQKKAEIVKKVAPQLKLSDLAAEFLGVLASKGHIGLLKDIIQDYERLVTYERNESRAIVTAAEPLTDDQRKRITEALKKKISGNKQLNLSEKIEPKILGGLIVTVDDKAVDLSVATQIRKIDSALRRQ